MFFASQMRKKTGLNERYADICYHHVPHWSGPNLNMVGVREPGVYGTETLATICDRVKEYAASLGLEAEFIQSNHEGVILDKILWLYSNPKCA